MKRFFTILSVTLAALAGLGSCKVMEEPQQIDALGQHSACFNGRVAELVDGTAETKGLSLVALPDWRKTAEANIHLYENGALGQNAQMTIDPEDNRVAYFTATFSGTGSQPYTYNAVIAPADEAGAFVVPAVQHPDSEKIEGVEGSGVSLIDPDADFLIGKTIQSDASYSPEDPVNLEFVRPVSLFRLAIVGLNKEEKIQEVALNTVETLTGKVNLSDIDLETGAATFDKAEGSNTVTLQYNNASPKIIFYAYYVVCPTETAFNTLVVKTDKANYTKTFTSGSKVKFASGTFHSIAVDMSDAVRDEPEAEKTKFYKVDKLAVGEEGLIVSNGYAMQNNSGALAAYEVTPSNDEIEIPGDVLESVVWSVSDSNGNDYGPYSISIDGKYIYVNGSYPNYSLGFAGEPTKYIGWNYADGQITNSQSSSSVRYLYYDSTSNKFAVDSKNEQSATFYSKTKPEDEPSTEESNYVLVKSADDITSGTYILAALSGNSHKYYFFDKNVSSKYTSDDMTDYVADDKIESNTTTDAYAVTITRSGDNLQINVPGKGYMYYGSSSISFEESSDSKANHSIKSVDSSSGDCNLSNKGSHSSTYLFNFSGSSNGFGYKGSRTSNYQILLFKLDNGSTPTPPAPANVTYTKVSANTGTLEAGTYLIVNKDNTRALSGTTTSGNTNYVTVAPSDNVITGDFSANEFTISVSGSYYTIKNASNQYLYSGGSNKTTLLAYQSDANDFTLETSSDYTDRFYFKSTQKFSSGGDRYLYYPSDGYFKIGGSGKPVNDDEDKQAAAGVYLYKKVVSEGGGQIAPATTSFNLENRYLTQYLDAAATSYTNGTTQSIVSTYTGSSPRDLPNPVSLTWTGSANSISIYEGTSTSGTAVKTQSFANSSTADIYNLIPGKTYSYKTSNGQTGTFTTTGRRRMIKVSDNASQNHARNCRDFGGIPTRSGKTLNYGLMYRGTNMDSATSEEKAILLSELGIKLDQDLRGSSSSPIGVTISGNSYDYSTIASSDGSSMKKTVSDVLESVIKGDPVYIHCQIGSDRTGHMCMLYQALLGCELKECDIDYEITSFANGVSGCGIRKIGSGNESTFRSKFINKAINGHTYTANQVPEAVEDYVVNTLGISLDTVKAFRKAMGVSETV